MLSLMPEIYEHEIKYDASEPFGMVSRFLKGGLTDKICESRSMTAGFWASYRQYF